MTNGNAATAVPGSWCPRSAPTGPAEVATMPALRRCATPGCPEITGATRCPDHQREHERQRGHAAARGYGHTHRRKRATIATRIDAGDRIVCVRCGQPIMTSSKLDLGHTDDRTQHSGPEHAHCNRAAGGRKAHQAAH